MICLVSSDSSLLAQSFRCSSECIDSNCPFPSLQQQFIKYGGTLLDKHQVIEIVPGPIVTVVTNKASFQTRQLVIAAGAWTKALCHDLGVHLPFKVDMYQ